MLLTITKVQSSSGTVVIGGAIGVLHTTSITHDLTLDQIEYLRPTLVRFASAGIISWSTAPTPDVSDNAAEGATVAYTTAFTAGATVGPWASVLYVDNVRGSDNVTVGGRRGDASRPFATVQAAYNAMQTDDSVLLAPQDFSLTTPLTVPATVTRFSCYGSVRTTGAAFVGVQGSQLHQLTAATSCINLGANLGLNRCVLSNIAFIPGSGSSIPAITGDGSAYPVTSFLVAGLFIVDCENVSVNLKYAFNVNIIGGGGNNRFTFVGCWNARFTRVNGGGSSCFYTYDTTDPHIDPAFGPGVLELRATTIMGGQVTGTRVVLTGHPTLRVDQTSVTGGIMGSGLTSANGYGPAITHCGFVGNTASGSSLGIDFASVGAELPDTAVAMLLDFSGARLFHETVNTPPTTSTKGIITAQFKIAGAAAHAQTVVMDNTVALAGTTFVASANIHITNRGAKWPNPILLTPDGTGDIMLPENLRLAPVAVSASPQPISYPCRIPSGSASDVRIHYESDNAAVSCTGVISARTQTGFSAGVSASTGANIAATVLSCPG